MKKFTIPAILLVLMQSASAQFGPMIGLGGEYSHSSRADFRDGSDNSVEIRQASSSISYIQPFQDGSSLVLGFSAERSDYDFNSPMPWEKVNDVTSFVMMEKATNSSWTLAGLGMVRSAWDSEARFEDGFGWGAGLGGKYHYSESLSFLVGFGYFSQLEGSGLWVPLVGVEWQITDRLNLEGLMGLQLNYDLFGNGAGILSLGFDYSLSDFRLKKDALSGLESAIRPEGTAASISYTHNFGNGPRSA
jgi:hypothetical protein